MTAPMDLELRHFVDTMPVHAWSARPDGLVDFFNRCYLDYVGLSYAEALDSGWTVTVHPEDRRRLIDEWNAIRVTEQPGESEARLRRFDGEYRWFLFRANPMRDVTGQVVKWYGTNTDIEDRRRAEKAVADSERNLLQTINTIPAFAWRFRADGWNDFLNQRWLDYTGVAAEDALGWGWQAVMHPDDLPRLLAIWQQLMDTGGSGEIEARIRRHDGVYRWFLFRCAPLRDETGRIVQWYGTNTDIDDLKQAEADLQRARDHLTDAQRLSKTGSFTIDLTTNEHIWSPEFYNICEVEYGSSVTDETLRRIVHPDDRPLYQDAMQGAMAGLNPNLAFRIVTTGGNVKHLRGFIHPTEHIAGQPLLVGAVQDVTEGKIAEDALNSARAELAHMARVMTLSTITASIAHEVSQPLAGITTNAGTCLRMLDADPPNLDGARATARRTARDANRASDVIERLRTMFARKALTTERVDLNQACREVLALLSNNIQRNRIALRTDFEPALPTVMGDKVQLQQVIMNLVLNACDAMRDVSGRPRDLLVSTARDDADGVRLSVSDSGIGIDSQNVSALFDAFFTTKTDGMGVGLSISRAIVESHNGTLSAHRNDGAGATFTMSIPRDGEPAMGAAIS